MNNATRLHLFGSIILLFVLMAGSFSRAGNELPNPAPTAPLAPDVRFNLNDGASQQRFPAIAMNQYGYAVVVWADGRHHPDKYKIYGQIINAKGKAFRENFYIDPVDSAIYQRNAQVEMNDRGHFVVVWDDDRESGDRNVYAKIFYANGVPLDEAIEVNEYMNNDQTDPAIAMDADGNFVVVWVDERSGYDEIYGQRFDPNGGTIGNNFLVSEHVTYGRGAPAVAMTPDGGFVVAWEDAYNFGVPDIYMQLYNSVGVKIGTNTEVSTHVGQETSARMPRVAVHQNGDILVCWHFQRAGEFANVYGRLYNQTGTTMKDVFIINETGGYSSQYPDVRANPTGGYGVVYNSTRDGNLNIRARILDADANNIGVTFRINDPDSLQQRACLGIDNRGFALFAWYDDRNGNDDIYATWSGMINPYQLHPVNLTAGSNFDGIVPLSWDHLYGDFPKVNLYHIYRSMVSGGPYDKIASIDLTERGALWETMRDWIDSDVVNGNYYYYVVTAEALGAESPYSNEAVGNPRADQNSVTSSWSTVAPIIDGSLDESEWREASSYYINDPQILSNVVFVVKNDADYLYLGVYDENDDVVDSGNLLGILFDDNNDNLWDATAPGGEGLFLINAAGAGYIGYWGTYPDALGADPLALAGGVQSTIVKSDGGLHYEVAINLHTSKLNASPGNTIGFGIMVDDPGNFYPNHYGYAGEWPWGLLWDCAAPLGDLELASVTDVAASDDVHPETFSLEQNYPNPFNPSTEIGFVTTQPGNVRLTVYDIQGREIRTLLHDDQPSGHHAVVWDGKDNSGQLVASGQYFYRLQAGTFSSMRKMVLMK